MVELEGNATFKTKYNIVLCSIYNEETHGPATNDQLQHIIKSHYLNIYNYNEHEEDSMEEETLFGVLNLFCNIRNRLNNYFKIIKRKEIVQYEMIITHKYIRNYKTIVEKKGFIQLEIAHNIKIDEYVVSIIKTFWIRWIQRCWKKVFILRKNIFKIRQTYNSISYREKYGKWPKNCIYFPGLKGLLMKKIY